MSHSNINVVYSDSFQLLLKVQPFAPERGVVPSTTGRAFDEVIGVNRKDGDAIHGRSSFRDKCGYLRTFRQAADRFTGGDIRAYTVLPCFKPCRHLQRFQHLQEAAWRVPWQGKGLGSSVQTQVEWIKKLFFLLLSTSSLVNHNKCAGSLRGGLRCAFGAWLEELSGRVLILLMHQICPVCTYRDRRIRCHI